MVGEWYFTAVASSSHFNLHISLKHRPHFPITSLNSVKGLSRSVSKSRAVYRPFTRWIPTSARQYPSLTLHCASKIFFGNNDLCRIFFLCNNFSRLILASFNSMSPFSYFPNMNWIHNPLPNSRASQPALAVEYGTADRLFYCCHHAATTISFPSTLRCRVFHGYQNPLIPLLELDLLLNSAPELQFVKCTSVAISWYRQENSIWDSCEGSQQLLLPGSTSGLLQVIGQGLPLWMQHWFFHECGTFRRYTIIIKLASFEAASLPSTILYHPSTNFIFKFELGTSLTQVKLLFSYTWKYTFPFLDTVRWQLTLIRWRDSWLPVTHTTSPDIWDQTHCVRRRGIFWNLNTFRNRSWSTFTSF